jgi:hypothetical protein
VEIKYKQRKEDPFWMTNSGETVWNSKMFKNTPALAIEMASFLSFTKRYNGKRDPCGNAQIFEKINH